MHFAFLSKIRSHKRWHSKSISLISILRKNVFLENEDEKKFTMTSQWPRWRLKSPASRLFTQPFIQTQIKENIKAPRHWPLWGEFTGTGEFRAQRASNAGNVSIWWRHHDNFLHRLNISLFGDYYLAVATVTSHHEPCTWFLAPVGFLGRRAQWATRKIFCLLGIYQHTSPWASYDSIYIFLVFCQIKYHTL